jgi:hypothetical protein
MVTLSNGFIILFNGLWGIFHLILTPIFLATIAIIVFLIWAAINEFQELSRQGTKPTVLRH